MVDSDYSSPENTCAHRHSKLSMSMDSDNFFLRRRDLCNFLTALVTCHPWISLILVEFNEKFNFAIFINFCLCNLCEKGGISLIKLPGKQDSQKLMHINEKTSKPPNTFWTCFKASTRQEKNKRTQKCFLRISIDGVWLCVYYLVSSVFGRRINQNQTWKSHSHILDVFSMHVTLFPRLGKSS